jgi:hypothetical protein
MISMLYLLATLVAWSVIHIPMHKNIIFFPVIAKWEYILKLFELYEHKPFHKLYKMRHLNPTAQSTMEVNLLWLT